MRVIEKTIFEFSELPDSAKGKARDWLRTSNDNDNDNFFSECVIEDAAIV